MAKRTHSFKRRTITRWTLSYIIATLIPFILVLASVMVALYYSSSSVTYSNSITASYVQRTFRDVLTRLNEIKAEIVVDSDFDELRSVEKLSDIPSIDLFYHASDIRRLEQTSSSVEKLFLFSPINDWYVSDQSWGRISEMALMEYLPLSQGRIDSILRHEIWDVYIHDISESEILLLIPLTYIRSSNPNNLSLGVIVSKKELFPDIIDDYHDVVIYSERMDSLVYSFSGRYEAGERDTRFASLELGSTGRVDNYVASVAEDLILSLKCIVLMDRGMYFRAFYILIMVLTASFISAVAFCAFLIKRNVSRDWTRYEAAVAASGVDLEKIPLESGDYAPFITSVDNLKAQREELTNVISRQKLSLAESAFHKLLDGDTEVTKETLSALGVELLSDAFCVVIAKCSDGDALGYLKDIVGNECLVVSFQSDYGDAFIINAASEDDEYYISLFRRVQEEGVLSELAGSLIHHGLESIRDSYLEAISVHEYQKDHDIPYLSYQEMLATTRQNTYQFTLEESMMLQKAMKEGDAEKAKSVMNRVIDRNRENGVSPKTLRFLLFSISGTIIRTINSLDSRFSEVIPEINFPPILQSQNFQKSLSGVEEIIDSTCYSISAVIASTADVSSETYQIYTRVLAYIQENYPNSMMNVSSVADSFGISIAYLSRIFKKYHGINISEYITGYRLEKAKSLLSEGRMVGDVVEECGFGSLRTFLRVFKTVEGITPGQYKSSVTKES